MQSNPSGADLFGYSVALDYLGDVALIGAPERNGTAGSAFTFAGHGKLSQQRELSSHARSRATSTATRWR